MTIKPMYQVFILILLQLSILLIMQFQAILTSEELQKLLRHVGNKAFVSNWAGGKEVMVIDALTDKLIDSIEVGIEPESMVVDRNWNAMGLCDGGWDKTKFS